MKKWGCGGAAAHHNPTIPLFSENTSIKNHFMQLPWTLTQFGFTEFDLWYNEISLGWLLVI